MNPYPLFAQIMDYPSPGLAATLTEAINQFQPVNPEAARRLRDCKAQCEHLGLVRLEELYTSTFDLQADCSLYAGYHLFGEDWRRNLFLAELMGRFQAAGFSCGNELPDHFAVLLRFLSVQTSREEESALRDDCLIPAAVKVAARLGPTGSPYRAAFEALLLCLGAPLSSAAPTGIQTPKESVL
jgi:nitrate reductase molybdenum cofactor assembly chaperone NarJ/NarW